MGFSSLAQPAIGPLIERFAHASDITLIVGAGASMEAGLPSWRELLERLLRRVAPVLADLQTPETQSAWVDHILNQEDLLAAGAIVESIATHDLQVLLPEELYGEQGPDRLEPGPIAQEIARLRRCFGDRLVLLTTNYDDLIERALVQRGFLRRDVKSYVQRRQPPAGSVAVTHLHGMAGRADRPRKLVLTEEHYHRMQRGSSWQEQLVTDRLSRSLCLFIGTTLTDPNLVRYLYGYEPTDRAHAVVFVRQADPETPQEVRSARECAVEARWRRLGVEAVFVDHFADAAQLLYEIGLRRERNAHYTPVGVRARQVIQAMERMFLPSGDPPGRFEELQVQVSRWLRTILYELLESTTGTATPPADERLALALWLLGRDGRTITGWAHSDRAHQDPATIEAVPIVDASDWVAVRTVCQGIRVDYDVSSPVSRWRFVRGLPLVFDSPTRLPVGCLTISSTKPSQASVLTTIDESAKTDLHHGLAESFYRMFAPFSEKFGT